VEEAAAASEALQDQASNLSHVVSAFRIDAAHVAAVVPIQRARQSPGIAQNRSAVPSEPRAPRIRQAVNAQHTAADGWEEF
jgi:methyl-accepting chemotaxis protein